MTAERLGETVIELDVSTRWEPAEEPLLRPRSRPWIAAFLVVVATLLLVAAGDRVGLPPPVLRPPESSQVMLITADRLYTVTQPARNPVMLNSYRLPTGEQLWSVPMRQGVYISYADDRHVIVFDAGPEQHDPLIDVLDAETGGTVWQRAGLTGAEVAGDVLITQDALADGISPPLAFTALSIDSGATRWTVNTPAGTQVELIYDQSADETADAQAVGLAQVGPDRTLRVRSIRTGQVQRSVTLAAGDPIDHFNITAGRVFTYNDRTQDLGAYDFATGRWLWGGAAEQMSWYLGSCGPVLCQETDGRVLGLDPDTGRIKWGFDSPNGFTMLADHRMVVIQSPLTADGRRTNALLVDAATGAVRRRLGSWRFLAGLGGDWILVWRSDDKGGAVVATLNVSTGGVDVIGVGSGWFGEPDCHTSAVYVACEDMLGLVVWRLPPDATG